MNNATTELSEVKTYMARRSNALELDEAQVIAVTHALESEVVRIPVKRSWAALVLATIEAACLFVVTAAKAGTLLGTVLGAVAGWAAFLHRDILRIPALLISILGASVNLFLLWRSYRLRNAPAAAWRKRALTTRDRWRIWLVLILSVFTLIVAGSEIYLHRLFHHSIM